jgi:hypothetical protein
VVTGLNAEGTYYWRVAANNFVGETAFSSAWSFTIVMGDDITLTGSTIYVDGVPHPRLTWTSAGQTGTYYIYRYGCNYGAGDCGVWPYQLLAVTTGTAYTDLSVVVATKLETPTTSYYYQVRSSGISNKRMVNSPGEAKESIENETSTLPKQTKLHVNYPNPFNPVTTIKYDLSANTHVSLKVFDMLGREVATLVDEVQDAGYRSVEFDAGQLSSGLYFYRLNAGNYSAFKKMMLVK